MLLSGYIQERTNRANGKTVFTHNAADIFRRKLKAIRDSSRLSVADCNGSLLWLLNEIRDDIHQEFAQSFRCIHGS